ncbi:hypothetical protein [Falsiphaeobacter marinintestinus]|uniref:hypothetical protein n=1 Tax=Falsiphaeobacter marinintestinus TaxID=1492905 RepID=UPI0011B400D8|nr:hypothetical protein [Phaeobacter marinintestinus]
MRLLIVLAFSSTLLAGCEACNTPRTNVNVGVGSGGVHTGASVGAQCGPVHVNVGSGRGYHPNW